MKGLLKKLSSQQADKPQEYQHKFWYLSVFLVLILLLLVAIYFLERGARIDKKLADLNANVLFAGHQFYKELREVHSDLNFIAKDSDIVLWLAQKNSDAKQRLQTKFINFSAEKKRYAQIRIISSQGMELLRVDRVLDRTQLIPDDWLQNKSTRYYFTEAQKLPASEVYQSKFDLNVEYGKVEIPYRPMLRFVMPVDYKGARLGFIVMNYSAGAALESFVELSRKEGLEINMLNAEGYYLYSPKMTQNWGVMFNQPEKTLGKQSPEVWQRLQQITRHEAFIADNTA